MEHMPRVDRQVPGIVALLGLVSLLLAFASTQTLGQTLLTTRVLGLLGLLLVSGAILLFGGRSAGTR